MTAIDLSKLPAPAVVEPLSFEAILAEMLADLVARDDAFTALVESDPAYKVLEVAAYREVLVRQRVNDAARAVLLATALGTNLEHLGALMDVPKLEGELDDELRARIALAPHRLSVAGPRDAYTYHALSTSPEVADVAVASPSPGLVRVHVLSAAADGVPSGELLDQVAEVLNADTVRPLTDTVEVVSAEILEYEVAAKLWLGAGPDASAVLTARVAAVVAYTLAQRGLGRRISLAGLYAALWQAGATSAVSLTSPVGDIAPEMHQVAICTGVTVELAGVDEPPPA